MVIEGGIFIITNIFVLFPDINLIQIIKDNIAVSSSSPHWQNWTAAKAVDFIKDSDPDNCDCCSGSTNEGAWWRLDLGNEYKISSISFVGRSDRKYEFVLN